jgi:uncharacterized protein
VRIHWGLVAIAYALLALIGAALSVLLHGGNPFVHPSPRLVLGSIDRHALSAASGLVFGAVVVITSRLAVQRWTWAQKLHTELGPVASGMTTTTVVVVAALSSLGEELLFRSLLTPLIGVWAQGLVFGLLHQVRGTSRWVWMSWAGIVGLALGAMYWTTGSLAGPLVAHALINGLNLAYLRDHRAVQTVGSGVAHRDDDEPSTNARQTG